MPYVPKSAEYVGYVNYDEAVSITHNSSLFGNSLLLEFQQLNFAVYPSDIVYEVVIQPPEPQYSGSTTLLKLTLQKENELVNSLMSANQTKIPKPFAYDGYTVHELLMFKEGDQRSNLGYTSIVNQHVILSNDPNTARQDLEFVLDQIGSNATSLFDEVAVRQAVYATGVTDQSYAGLFVGLFSTQLNDTKMAAKSIVGNGNSLVVSRALLFPSPDIALERVNQAHIVYRNASSYRILDSWLVVEYNYPLTRMQPELTGI
jgi:hypothetical protein